MRYARSVRRHHICNSCDGVLDDPMDRVAGRVAVDRDFLLRQRRRRVLRRALTVENPEIDAARGLGVSRHAQRRSGAGGDRNERVQADGVADRPRQRSPAPCTRRGSRSRVPSPATVGASMSRAARNAKIRKPIVGWMSATAPIIAPLTTRRAGPRSSLVAAGEEDEHRREHERDEHGLELKGRGRGDQVRIHRDDRGGEQPDALRRTPDARAGTRAGS